MNKVEVQIHTLYPDVQIPEYGTVYSSGFDLRAYLRLYPIDFEKIQTKFNKVWNIDYKVHTKGFDNLLSIELLPFKSIAIPTGIKIALPENYELQARPRSGLAIKQGLVLANTPGTIDTDYRGELLLLMYNQSNNSIYIDHEAKIAQGVVAPFVQATWIPVPILSETVRGDGGFGSTGV